MRALTLSLAVLFCSAAAAMAQGADPGAVLAANHAATGRLAAGRMDLTYAFAGQGMTGEVTSGYDLATGAFVDAQVIGPTTGANGFDGKQAWQRDLSGMVTPEAGGDKRQLAVNEAYRDANLWWRADRGGAAIAPLSDGTANGKTYRRLSVTPKGGKVFEAWFDPTTHLLARTVEMQGFQTITTDDSDYREVHGLKVPGKVVVDDGLGAEDLQTMTFRRAAVTPAVAAAAYAAPASPVTDAAIHNATGRTTVPFQLLNNHIYAEVKVNGKGPFLFIFDTGGHDLLTPGTAKALGVTSQGSAAGSGAGEATVDVSFARGVSFRIGDLEMTNQSIVVLPFASKAVEGFDDQGMMGFELFRRFVTVVDYGAKTLTFIDPAKFHPTNAGVAVPFAFYDQLPQVKGTFEGAPATFDIDTGSRAEITVTKPFADAQHLRESHPKGVVAVDGWGVGGRSISYVTKASGLTMGAVKVDNVIAGLATQTKGSFADPNYQGNIGTRLLKRFVVTFDYGHQLMYLKALPAPVADIGTFDRSGAWINASDKGFKVVDVTAGSAAAEAGLKVGDEITAVGGAAATGLTLSDVRATLRDAKVAKVSLTVVSGGASRIVELTLRDQV